ncbi:acyl-CoA dehydrogenase family protein [Paraburkholderia unamae]|uniref:Acyl-CoA dehydrogenase n=1 Tax=Paraburkholderia unamae TaxID=219649 RepID=A0ABX5KRI0_9BURK|nr:acyl-CoA dehydrogenase family protein [Paraburkholderia unamae]PVX82760.1 acyl-CoA dehydrogenase [Paraburkholderia unamae]CAG9269377.1 Butyryl-CoA dehydrogenase [Paraburkholderia unamae]
MDFSIDSKTRALRDRIRTFVDDVLLPLESSAASYDEHENVAEGLLGELRAQARERGLWSLQMPRERGGGGLSVAQMAVCYEEMNRSIFGPVVFNSAAPDDGNMILLNKVATPDQKDQWLQPIIDGKVRSAFAMTEPAPGAGSDPSMMLTRAERAGDKWIIHGRKWFITGAAAATHFILIARTSADARKGLTAFLFHANTPGWRIIRRIPIMGPEEHGGHCEIEFDGLEIPDAHRLMEVGDGLKATQIRLGTARLTHCMRWNGMARRALELAVAHVNTRKAGGDLLAAREGVQWMLGEAAMKLDVARLLTMRAACCLDTGDFARAEISMAKIAASETLHQVVDTAIQLHGAKGYSKDTRLEWMYRYARQARLVDGASEVHKMVVARSLLETGSEMWNWKTQAAEPTASKE